MAFFFKGLSQVIAVRFRIYNRIINCRIRNVQPCSIVPVQCAKGRFVDSRKKQKFSAFRTGKSRNRKIGSLWQKAEAGEIPRRLCLCYFADKLIFFFPAQSSWYLYQSREPLSSRLKNRIIAAAPIPQRITVPMVLPVDFLINVNFTRFMIPPFSPFSASRKTGVCRL